MSGGIDRIGTIGKITLEQWFSSNSDAIEATGYNEIFGTQEPFMFTSSYHIHSADFSNLVLIPTPSMAMSRRMTQSAYFSGRDSLDQILSSILRMRLRS